MSNKSAKGSQNGGWRKCLMIFSLPNNILWLTSFKIMVEGTIGTRTAEIRQSSQVILAGATPAAMLRMATRTGELVPTTDPRETASMTKAGTDRPQTVTVLREEM